MSGEQITFKHVGDGNWRIDSNPEEDGCGAVIIAILLILAALAFLSLIAPLVILIIGFFLKGKRRNWMIGISLLAFAYLTTDLIKEWVLFEMYANFEISADTIAVCQLINFVSAIIALVLLINAGFKENSQKKQNKLNQLYGISNAGTSLDYARINNYKVKKGRKIITDTGDVLVLDIRKISNCRYLFVLDQDQRARKISFSKYESFLKKTQNGRILNQIVSQPK